MDTSRRTLFEQLLLSGTLAALANGAAKADTVPAKTDSQKFWDGFFDDVSPGVRSGKGTVTSALDRLIAPERDVVYLHYKEDHLRFAHEIKKEELIDYPGDVSVTMTMGQFQPAGTDARSVARNKSSQLRIDCVQTHSFMNVIAPLAWCALASVYTDQAGKIPPLQTLGWQNDNSMSGANRIVLPAGMGKVAVNVSLAHQESLIHKILNQAVTVGSGLSPLVGLPAISIQALKAFTQIYSYLEERAAFLLNSALTYAAATQQAVDADDMPEKYVPLVTGEYVLVPSAAADQLAARLDKYKLTQGYVIDTEKAANRQAQITTLKDQAGPGVTYLTLKMTVAPLQPGQPAAPKNSTDTSADDTSPPAAKKAAPKSNGTQPKPNGTQPKTKP